MLMGSEWSFIYEDAIVLGQEGLGDIMNIPKPGLLGGIGIVSFRSIRKHLVCVTL